MTDVVVECPHDDRVKYPVFLIKSFEGVMNYPDMKRKYMLCQACIAAVIDEIPKVISK